MIAKIGKGINTYNVKVVLTWEALAYHFTCTSSRGPAWFDKENVEAQQRLKVQQEADSYELCRFTIDSFHFLL